MNLGNSIGGITLMLLAIVWLAVFVPQWASRAQEPSTAALRSKQKSDRMNSGFSPTELQLLRLTRTRAQMGSVAISGAFVWIGLFFLTSGTPVGFILWPVALIVIVAGLLSAAAYRRLLVVAGNSGTRRQQQLSESSLTASPSLRATPLQRRSWAPNPLPQPLQERKVGEFVMRGSKVVPLVETSSSRTPKEAGEVEPAAIPETASIQIDEILRRRRAN